ncbi:MAG: EF-hand domain-containing protein [Planctomycetes bacterium]|nr:EF-hand domain-containing protein [Planctomycetota bacterium]MCW8135589.1 EF-hand domain-containing protein [Planctomycetota bacterium]
MKKVVPAVLLALIGVAVGVALYFTVFDSEPPQQANGEPPRTDQEFDIEGFMARFDDDTDGKVSREEFDRHYDKGEPRFVISAKGGKAAPVDAAWRILDLDADGFITEPELKRYTTLRWAKHRMETEARGLTARAWGDTFLALNSPLLIAYESQKGAIARNEVPVAGRAFERKYLASWAEVRTARGEAFEAWVSTIEGRTYVLQPHYRIHEVRYDPEVEKTIMEQDRTYITEWAAPVAGSSVEGQQYPTWGRIVRGGGSALDLEGFIRREPGLLRVAVPSPRLRVMNAADTEIRVKDNAPQMQYVARAKELKFEDTAGALALARDCVKWGMVQEALAMYLRVLIFSPGNTEALDYWGIEVRDEQFYPRKR